MIRPPSPGRHRCRGRPGRDTRHDGSRGHGSDAPRPGAAPVTHDAHSAGRTIVIDPGHQLGNHNFPRQINRQGPGRRVQEAVQHDGDRDPWRPPGGDVRVAGRPAAEDAAREPGRPGRPHPAQQPAGPVGPLRRRARTSRQQRSRRPEAQHPRGRQLHPRRPRASTSSRRPIASGGRTTSTCRRGGWPGRPGRRCGRSGSRSPTTPPVATASTSAPTSAPSTLPTSPASWSSSATCGIVATPAA